MGNTNPAACAMALPTKGRVLLYLFLFIASAQWWAGLTLFAGSVLPPDTVLVTNYLTLAGQPAGTPLTAPMLYTNVIPTNSGNFVVYLSPNAAGQFSVSTNGLAAHPMRGGKPVVAGPEAPDIQFSNALNFSTIEFALPGTNQSYLSVSGLVNVPALANTPATYDLVVLASGLDAPPYSTEDWTLQLNCGLTNFIQFEDAREGTSVKYGARPFPANTWLSFTMVMDTTNLTEYGAVFNATDGSLVASYTNTMGLANSYLDYWLFGNNEAGSQPGTCFYFSGLNWSNTPLPATPPPYTPATNELVGQWKFDGDLSDSSPNGNDGAEFGGSYNYVIGADGVAGQALAITNGTISTFSTNPVGAVTVSFWINTAASGMPIAFEEFTSWYAYVAPDGTVQFDLRTSGGHLNASTSDNWFGAWHLYTATWDGAGDGELRIYKDGVLDTVTSSAVFGSLVPSLSNLTIASGSSGFAMSGWLEDVRVYGRALDASEVASLYALGADGAINLYSVAPVAPVAPLARRYALTTGHLVQFWKSAHLKTWAAAGPVTNRLVLATAGAAGYFRAQAVADLHWAASPAGKVNGYLVSQWFEPAPGTSMSTNFFVAPGQTNIYVPLRGTGTNWFSVTANGVGARDRISTRVAWGPALFTVTLAPF